MNKTIYRGAERMQGVQFSPVRKVLERTMQLSREGRSVIHFEIGEPDFNTPKPIIEATKAALDNNLTHYGPNRGLLSLREAIAYKLETENGLPYNPETEILVTVGVGQAIMNILLANVNPDEEIIIFPPTFMNYRNVAALADARIVNVPLKEENDFQIDPAAVRKAISEKTKMLIIANPNNPTGSVTSPELLRQVAEIAVENDLLVMSDEIYADIVYEGVEVQSIAALPGMRERTYVLNGFSKNYAMTGWRLGYIAADERLIPNVLKAHQYTTTCAPTFLQDGVARTMMDAECLRERAEMVEEFAKRRSLLIDGLGSIPKLTTNHPQGAFYILLNVSKTGLSGEEFATRLLDEYGVATVPSIGFGIGGEDYVRLSYATDEASIQEGIHRIKQFIESCRL